MPSPEPQPAQQHTPVRPRRIEAHGWRGSAWDEVPVELLALLPWLTTGATPPGTEVLKPGVVWRWNDWCLKLFQVSTRWRDRWRSNPALRSARLHFALLPDTTSPRPLLALERAGFALLVNEFAEGELLRAAWPHSPAAREALAPALVRLNRQGRFHGDLHAANLIWNGSCWVFLDLVGLRPPLHALLPGRRIQRQWARLARNLPQDPYLRASFERYCDELPWRGDRQRCWQRILALAAVRKHRPRA